MRRNHASLSGRKSRRGTVIAQTAVMMSVVFAAMAMALDGGAIVTEWRHAQATVDAAALAAAADLFNNYLKYSGADTKGTAASAAKTVASFNGYTNTGKTVASFNGFTNTGSTG